MDTVKDIINNRSLEETVQDLTLSVLVQFVEHGGTGLGGGKRYHLVAVVGGLEPALYPISAGVAQALIASGMPQRPRIVLRSPRV
jgi:hypothetical protein